LSSFVVFVRILLCDLQVVLCSTNCFVFNCCVFYVLWLFCIILLFCLYNYSTLIIFDRWNFWILNPVWRRSPWQQLSYTMEFKPNKITFNKMLNKVFGYLFFLILTFWLSIRSKPSEIHPNDRTSQVLHHWQCLRMTLNVTIPLNVLKTQKSCSLT
jgi:hypothetical protein